MARAQDGGWRVYDTNRASYPTALPRYGSLKEQYKSQVEAQTVADELNQLPAVGLPPI